MKPSHFQWSTINFSIIQMKKQNRYNRCVNNARKKKWWSRNLEDGKVKIVHTVLNHLFVHQSCLFPFFYCYSITIIQTLNHNIQILHIIKWNDLKYIYNMPLESFQQIYFDFQEINVNQSHEMNIIILKFMLLLLLFLSNFNINTKFYLVWLSFRLYFDEYSERYNKIQWNWEKKDETTKANENLTI